MADPAATIAIGGTRYELVGGDDVRAADIAACRVTLRRVADGVVVVLTAAELMMPPLATPDRVPKTERLELRELVEELLGRGFDDRWVEAVAEFVSRHRLLRTAP